MHQSIRVFAYPRVDDLRKHSRAAILFNLRLVLRMLRCVSSSCARDLKLCPFEQAHLHSATNIYMLEHQDDIELVTGEEIVSICFTLAIFELQ